MNVAETIKAARERLGMTQEDLAEKLEVSRQAVSKWELGASVPSPENLALLEEVLEVHFPAPEEAAFQGGRKESPRWKIAALVLGVLMAAALLSIGIYCAVNPGKSVDAPRPLEPVITDIAFYDRNAVPLFPDLGDGWNSFTAGERVLVLVAFQNGTETDVNAVSLFLTPTGTETFDLREQVAVQAVADGRDFALFAWDIPESMMGHLDVTLECGGGLQVTETLNVTALTPSEPSEAPGVLSLNTSEIIAAAGDTSHFILEAYGVPFAEVEWSSSDPSVARVANTGTVFIEGEGEAVITASWNGQSAECLVHVHAGSEPADAPDVSALQ